MGGKTKQTQRTKNNAKPSNSGRSAELLGASVPSFVGFTAHTNLGLVPFAPGFSTTDSLPDTFDSILSSEMQIVLRKLSKKDPITKNKALTEFHALITDSELDVVVALLSLWPKFYQNLANDIDHRVRENAQQTQSLLVSKAGKNVAPFLKQLIPIWLCSQFDNYPPAASVAISSFKSAFPPMKVQEVCLFCKNEILDYIIRNLTFHTAQTLSSSITCTPEEAEHKYQRVVISSLKTFAFYLEKTESKQCGNIEEKTHCLIGHPKFWSFAKHKVAAVKSAWFELIYAILQYAPSQLEGSKTQVIQVVFQNLDETDPATLPHVWGCILLIQRAFPDWYENVNFVKSVQPKLVNLLKSGLNGNATALCPNLLPFISKLFSENIPRVSLNELINEHLAALKASILSTYEISVSKSDTSAMISAFYECIRYTLQKWTEGGEKEGSVGLEVGESYLRSYIIDLIRETFKNNGIATRFIYTNVSALIAFWSENTQSKVYTKLLKAFWIQLFETVTGSFVADGNNDLVVERVVELIHNLYYANSSLHDHKVKFSSCEEENHKKSKSDDGHKSLANYVKADLKCLAIELTRLGVENLSNTYISHIRKLTDMFGDVEFYSSLSKDRTLKKTLQIFTGVLETSSEPSEEVVEIVFHIVYHLETADRIEALKGLLLLENKEVQQWILQRMLSHPMCVQPYVHDLLSQPHVVAVIHRIAEDVLAEDSKEKLNLLHKCFFQIESGDILVSKEAVTGIINIMSKPLSGGEELEHMVDTCGSFIAQIMPVICSDNASESVRYDTFLKLYRFSIDMIESDKLSEDTLWEITSCWQDALSSGDITTNPELISKCSQIMQKRFTTSERLSIDEITNIADMVSKFVMCATESLDDEEERMKAIDSIIDAFFKSNDLESDSLGQMCSLIEGILATTSVSYLRSVSLEPIQLRNLFRKSLILFCTIFKMTCNVQKDTKEKLDDEEYTEDYFDPTENLLQNWSVRLYAYILESMKVAAIGESLLNNSFLISDELELVVLSLSEKVKIFLLNSPEKEIEQIKKELLAGAARNDLDFCRALPFLLQTSGYLEFEDSALVVFMEEIADFMLEKKSYQAYINLVQFIKKEINSRSLAFRPELTSSDVDLFIQIAEIRNRINNHFSGGTNEIDDRKIITQALQLVTTISESNSTQSNVLLYNTDVSKEEFSKVALVVEYVNFLSEILEKFSSEFNLKTWDVVRLGLSSWVLSVSRSINTTNNPKTLLFTSAVYKLNANLSKFISVEKTKSSTAKMSSIVDEWESLFAKEVNIVLFKCFRNLVSQCKDSKPMAAFDTLLDVIAPCIEYFDYSIIYSSYHQSSNLNLYELINFLLDNISHHLHCVRTASMFILQKLSYFIVLEDMDTLEKNNESLDRNASSSSSSTDEWHFLSKLRKTLEYSEANVIKYIEEFSYKLTEISELKDMDRLECLNYMCLWDCIMFLCSNAPVELRSVYATWISENKFEQNFLNFVFRAMPAEILKNHDSKLMSTDLFKGLTWGQIKERNLQVEKYACHLYSEMLRRLPAIARKWWNSSHSRQKTFVDKLTTNFVSSIICQEELRAISQKKEKHENMQVTVHTSTREVMACYSIDEARMELVITLAQNHPLGGVKVEIGKQIGGKASSRNVGMQLTIFLTHQNGSIFDGLSLWKKNLDKKFEGVEECYVCYTVIHQDTCQLPKLSCRTCKKKFHGPCLYKWFTTSSKSTCPICRNVF